MTERHETTSPAMVGGAPEAGEQDYRVHKAWSTRAAAEATERLEPMSRRERRSELSAQMLRTIARGKYHTRWKGLEVMKDPFDLVLYQKLFWDLRPRTVIELGAYAGGTTVWMADMMAAMGLRPRIISVDIDLSLLAPEARARHDITFLEGDANRIEETFPPAMLAALEHPLLLIEDAHVNVSGVLEHFHRHALQPGDYLILDDTNPEGPKTTHMAVDDAEVFEPFGPDKLDTLTRFLERHPDEYRVDGGLCDLFGYNVTWNWSGYVKRI